MATDVERLVVSLEASAKKFENAMNRAVGVTNSSMRSVEWRTEQATNRINQAFSRAGAAVKTGLASILAGLSVQQIVEFADSFTKVQNSLKVAGLEGQNLRRTYEEIYAISQRQAAPLEAMATLYGRLSSSQKELNVSGSEMLRFTELVGMALRVQGTSAQEASGALLQLSQALGGGKIQAEEYNSLLDGARPLLQAVAAGMVETGGSVAKLTALVKEGKVSSEAFFRAALAGYPILQKQAASAGTTMSQSMGKARDALTNLVGKLAAALDASNAASGGVNSFVATIDGIANAVPGAMSALDELYGKMTEIGNSDVFKRFNEWMATKGLSGMNGVEPANSFNEVFGADAKARRRAGSMTGYRPPTPEPAIEAIRNSDYAVPGDGKGGKSRRQRENELQREIAQIQERTRALDAERQTVGMSSGDAAKAEAAFRLLEAAKQANVEVTPTLREEIDKLAAKYGEATQKIEDARQAQEEVAQAAAEVGDALSTAFEDAILNGEKLNDVLKNLMRSLASKALNNIFTALFSPSGGGFNIVSAILGKRAAGGPVSANKPYLVGEKGPELMVPTSAGKVIPNHKLGQSGSTSMSLTVQVVGARGNAEIQQMVQAGVRQGLSQYDRALPSRLSDINIRYS